MCGTVLCCTVSAQAQEMEPRSYSNAPVGMNFLGVGYGLSRGNIVAEAAIPIEDFHVTANTIVLAYVRVVGIAGKQAKLSAVLPFTWLSGSATLAGQDTTGARTGFADARLKFSVNLLGGPALSPAEFKGYQQNTIVGASVVVAVPTGHYVEDKLINIGAHRWGVKPEVGVSQRLGHWYAELFTGIWMFTDNDEYLETQTLSQDAVWSTQGHVSYVFRAGLWLAGNAVYVNGGETSVDGVSKHNFQRNWRFGATAAVPIAPRHGLKFAFNTGVQTRIGADFDSYSVVYQYSWF